jgi:hypothetical protein
MGAHALIYVYVCVIHARSCDHEHASHQKYDYLIFTHICWMQKVIHMLAYTHKCKVYTNTCIFKCIYTGIFCMYTNSLFVCAYMYALTNKLTHMYRTVTTLCMLPVSTHIFQSVLQNAQKHTFGDTTHTLTNTPTKQCNNILRNTDASPIFDQHFEWFHALSAFMLDTWTRLERMACTHFLSWCTHMLQQSRPPHLQK